MIAKQSVFLNSDHSKAVPEGDPDAKFLLVRAGHDISEAQVERYDALNLVNSAVSGEKPEAPKSPAPKAKAKK